jgi:hypothetical protein
VATSLVTLPTREDLSDFWDYAAESDAGRAERLLDLFKRKVAELINAHAPRTMGGRE